MSDGAVPDVIGTVKAIRDWGLDDSGLTGVYITKYKWQPGWNVAKCDQVRFDNVAGAWRPKTDDHIACIELNCLDGFYAYYDRRVRGYRGRVTGVIETAGVVMRGSQGIRAQRARIVALYLDKALDVPKVLKAELNPIRQVARWFNNHPRLTLSLAIATTAVLTVLNVHVFDSLWLKILMGWLAATGGLTFWILVGSVGWDAQRLVERTVAKNQYALSALRGGLSDPEIELIKARYPDVRYYDSIEAMVEAEKLDTAPPANEDFEPFNERDNGFGYY